MGNIRIIAGILLLGLLVRPAVAQLPESAPPPAPASVATSPSPAPDAPLQPPGALSQSVFLDVRDLGNDVSSSYNWHTYWGAYSKNQQRSRALELMVRNPAKVPAEYLIEWYFFAVPVRGGGKRVLYDTGSQTLSMAAGGLEKAGVVSAELESQSSRYAGYYGYYNSTYRSGMKPDGWAVTVKVGDKLIRTKSSNAQIEEIMKKTAEFDVILARFERKSAM